MNFTSEDYFKAIVLYGLNTATYKMALAHVLLDASEQQITTINWKDLSKRYFDLYQERLSRQPMPQQGIPSRLTKMERIVMEYQNGTLKYQEALQKVGDTAFEDVVPRFQTIGTKKILAINSYFFEPQQGQRLVIKDSMLDLKESQRKILREEVNTRWALLEGAFTINQTQFGLGNDIREVYLRDGYERKSLTDNIPFLSGYQGNTCFYCGENFQQDIHVDHVLPRQVLHHDEIWNLVLAHAECNLQKSDKLVGEHFIVKLIARNENIMGSNHPWKAKIQSQLGKTPSHRARTLRQHYENVKTILGAYYWGGHKDYNPENDRFYKSLITVLNKK